MSKFYQRMYEIAELDLKAADLLANKKLFAHSIYFYAQTFEKINKSIISFYMEVYQNIPEKQIESIMKTTFGHKLIKITMEILKSLTKEERDLYVSRGGKESDNFIQHSLKSIESLGKHKIPIDDLIINFQAKIEYHYEILYKSLYVNDYRSLDSRLLVLPSLAEVRRSLQRVEWVELRNIISQPSKKYLKLMPIAWLLSPLLEMMDVSTRYPMGELLNNNIPLLQSDQNSKSCKMLHEMLKDYFSAVKQVREKIQKLDKNSR